MIKLIRVFLIVAVVGLFSLSQLSAHTIDCCDTQTHSASSQDHIHSNCAHCSLSLLPVPMAEEPLFAGQAFSEFTSVHFPDPELRKPLQPPRS